MENTLVKTVSVEDFGRQIQMRRGGTQKTIEQKIEAMRGYSESMKVLEDKMADKFPLIKDALHNMGLGISQVHCRGTGNLYDMDKYNVMESDDGLFISITAKAISGKMRFLKFSGYTASGSGQNMPRLRKKAENMQDALTSASGFSCEVNPFSLEYKDTAEDKSVLIQMWVKK